MNRRDEACSPRQLGVLVFVALLAPASALPPLVAAAGPLSWLAPVIAMPVAALAAWWLDRFNREGLGSRLKGGWGAVLRTLYYIWVTALSALTAGSCVDRLSRTDYLTTPNWLLSLALTLVAAYLSHRDRGPFSRSVEVFYLALLAVLFLFLSLGLVDLDLENLRPTRAVEAKAWLSPLVATLSTLSVGSLVLFLPQPPPQTLVSPPPDPPQAPSAPPSRPRFRPPALLGWLLGWCGVAAALCLLTLGALGPGLTAQAPLPFFLALQGVGVRGGFQRLEALGTAAWVLSDLALLGLASLAARSIAYDRRWAFYPPLIAGFFGGCFLGNGAVSPYSGALFAANLILGGILPSVLACFSSRRYFVGKRNT